MQPSSLKLEGVEIETQDMDIEAHELAAAKAGDERAFAWLYRHYAPMVRRRLLLVSAESTAIDDLCQQVFLEVFRSLSKFRGDSKFSTWLTRITINVGLQHRRRKKPWYSVLWDDATAGEVAIEVDFEGLSDAKRAWAALATIDPKLRVPLVLREVEGLGLQEIADIVSCSPSTVSARIEKAQRETAKILLKGGLAS